MDLSKLRVVDLKQELQNRGLDTKGVKAVLISRLQAAIDTAAEAEESESNDVEEGSDAGGGEEESILPDEVTEDPGVTHSPSPEPAAPPVVAAEESSVLSRESVEEETAPKEPEVVPEAVEEPMEVAVAEPEASPETVDAPKTPEEPKEEDPVDAYTQNETMPMDEVAKQAEEVKVAEPEPEKEDKKRRRSRSPSSSDGGARRRPRRDSQSANTDDFMNIEDEPTLPETPCLSWVDSDLHVKISGGDFCEGRTMSDGVLGLMWAGARATHGITSGRCFYEVQLLQRNTRVSFPDEKNLFDLRCGWSTLATDLQLGESQNSFAFTSDGKKCHGEAVEDFGVKFSVGDVVGVYLDVESDPCKVQYTVNGEDQGVAFEFAKETLNGEALFPHVLTKNVTFKVNFGQLENTLLSEFKPKKRHRSESEKKEKQEEKPEEKKPEEVKPEEQKPEEDEKPTEEKPEEDKAEPKEGEEPEKTEETPQPETLAETPEEKMETEEAEEPEKPVNRETLPDFVFVSSLPREELVEGLKRPETRKDCEVVMMIGLPGAGKTHWVTKWNEENPDKRYNVIGNDYLYKRMTNRSKQKNDKFNDLCNRSFTVLQELAQKRRRNYILDQTNVFASAQRRKMKGFGDFKRIAVIVIPDDEEYKRRLACKNEGDSKELADNAVNEMKANFSLPTSDLGWFDEIKYVDLQDEAAAKLVAEYNEKGRRALPQATNRRPYDDRRRRDYNYDRRWDRGERRDRWQPSMGGPRGPSGWRPPPPPREYYGGGYDRRPGNDRWNSPNAWVSGGRRSNERDYRRDYGHRDYQRNRDRDSRSGRSGRDQDFRERRSDNRGGGGDNYGSRSSHSSSRSSRRDYPSSKSSGSSSAMKSYDGSAQPGMPVGGAAMATQGGAAWGAGWAGQQQWQMGSNWGAQGWHQGGWNAGGQNWGGWNYGVAPGVNGADWSANSWDVNQAAYTSNSCPNMDATSDQTN